MYVVVFDPRQDRLTDAGRRARWRGSMEKGREAMAGRSLAEGYLLVHLIQMAARGRR
jgi:hypothetical protein